MKLFEHRPAPRPKTHVLEFRISGRRNLFCEFIFSGLSGSSLFLLIDYGKRPGCLRITRQFRVYWHLYRVNKAFQYLESNLELLLSNEVLERGSAEVWRNRLGELQAEINRDLTGRLHQQESGEVRRLGPVVEAWEEEEISGKRGRKRR